MCRNKKTRFAVFVCITALMLVAGCATGPKPSDIILARFDAPIMDVPVQFQRMSGNVGGATEHLADVVMPRRLVVTPTELTMPGGNGNQLTPWEFTLSFAIVESVEVKRIQYDPFGLLSAEKTIDAAVVITDQRGLCRRACVFLFQDDDGEPDLAAANRFVEIVTAGRAIVDPFGRSDGPRRIATAVGLRAPRPRWRNDIRDAPDEVRQTATRIEEQVMEYAKVALRTEYRQCLVDALNNSLGDAAAWSFLAIDQVGVKQNTELNVTSVVRSEELKSLGANSMLVSDIYGLGFVYIAPDDDDPARVETVFRAFVDFYDLSPMKDGRYFWFDFQQQRTLAEFVIDPVAAVRQDIDNMCRAFTARVVEEFSNPVTDEILSRQ